MITAPIWKDTYYTANTSMLSYRIECDGEDIFYGKAYRAPDADYLYININKICQNYLDNSIEDFIYKVLDDPDYEIAAEHSFREFNLYDTTTGRLLETFGFLNDWSYKNITYLDYGHTVLDMPINGHYEPRMARLTSRYYAHDMVYIEGGGYDYNIKACGDYALYYSNNRGGWDSFLIEGTVKKTDNVTKHDYDRKIDNSTYYKFEGKNYLNEISTTYTLNTGFLNDDEAARLAEHLLPSTDVYLHNLNTGEVIPVIITNTTNDYKTFKNTRQLVYYTITVKASKNKMRK